MSRIVSSKTVDRILKNPRSCPKAAKELRDRLQAAASDRILRSLAVALERSDYGATVTGKLRVGDNIRSFITYRSDA